MAINIKGGVVSIGKDDNLQDTTIQDAVVVVALENAKSQKEVEDWLGEHLDGVELFNVKVVTADVYAEGLAKIASEKAEHQAKLKGIVEEVKKRIETVTSYKAPLIERVVGSKKFWIGVVVLNALYMFDMLTLGADGKAALFAVTFGSFFANLYFAVKRVMRIKNAMKNLPLPPGFEVDVHEVKANTTNEEK